MNSSDVVNQQFLIYFLSVTAVDVLLPASGFAVCNVGGTTLHSFAGLQDGRCETDQTALESLLSLNPQTAQEIRYDHRLNNTLL